MKFGLYAIDLNTKKRIPRNSSKIFREIVEYDGVPSNIESRSL